MDKEKYEKYIVIVMIIAYFGLGILIGYLTTLISSRGITVVTNTTIPTQTPYVINHTIRVTTTKYIYYRLPEFQTATPTPTRTVTPVPPPTQTPTATPTKVVTEFFTNSDPMCSLNLRTEPSLAGEIVGKIPHNWVVQVTGAVVGETVRGSNLWCLVEANILYSKDVYVWCKGLKPISKDLLE